MSEDFNHFPGIAAVIHEACAQVVTKTALDVQAKAQQRAPVDTGALKNSIAVQDGEDDTTKYVIVGVDYGIYQEYGTRFMPAHPYFIPAIDAARPGFEAAIDAIRAKMESAK